MKKFKAILCIALALVMVFALIACNKDNTSSDGTPANTSGGSSGDSSGGGSSGGGSGGGSSGGGSSGGGSGGGSSGDSQAAGGSNIPKSITIGVTGWLGRFLPGMSPNESFPACNAIYDVAFLTDPVTKEFTSTILEDWYFQDDLTFIMKLKQGIYFSNGDEATAEDLLYSYKSFSERGAVSASGLGNVVDEECKVLDKYTVQWKLVEPFGRLQSVVVYLFNKSWSQSVGWDSDEWYNPVTSGPYYVHEYVADNYMVLRLRENYWDTSREFGVEEWIIKYYPEASTLYMELELGNISLCEITANDYSRYVKDGANNVKCQIVNLGVAEVFCMGQEDNPQLEDKAVRLALAHGVNWEQMGVASRGDGYMPENSFIPKESPFYVDVGTYEFNPDKAKQILADAGYQPGDINLHLYIADSVRERDLSEVLQYFCQQIGINVSIDSGDRASYLNAVAVRGGSDAGFVAHAAGSINRDPAVVLQFLMIHNFNFVYVADEKWQQMAHDVVYNSNYDSRKALYAELAKYTYDEVLVIPYCTSVANIGYRTDVFTQEQIDRVIYTNNNYWLQRLSLTSEWN